MTAYKFNRDATVGEFPNFPKDFRENDVVYAPVESVEEATRALDNDDIVVMNERDGKIVQLLGDGVRWAVPGELLTETEDTSGRRDAPFRAQQVSEKGVAADNQAAEANQDPVENKS